MRMTPAGREAGRPLRRDAQRNRERILAAARKLFAERGIDATLDDVAARAGVGVGTVYRRYPNKDALLDELFEERIAELAALAEASLSDADAWAALVRFLERVEELFAADRALEHLVLHTDFEAADIRIIHTMLAAVVHETHAVSPDLWRRYFVMIVDGLASNRSSPTVTRSEE